ncbi:uncharacterized protein LOC110858178 [Folsomia candida]|uniref:F-box domain-containing protein n=1 Tax=Folsomia candida TaxID=158441 RepID=A0A226DIC3_FOLCA|nr:uncharacterized protein LOC110858178 [Folsomia candida]XP_035714404.1 uncharacterized protein LOC110858178 [Folsomia candida]XP_035714405.1 uncharacterized protein LOC110858178 [Folsomia candida]OXA43936.1 hypothetical protein Fcan01_21070 [Folsomia candida]
MAKVVDLTSKNRHPMTLRSASSREDSKEVPVDLNTAMSKALQNPLVLDLIFSNLGLPDLKTSRLVCPEWADVGTTFLGRRALLHLNKLFSYEGSEPAKMTPVNDKLMRRLLISDKFDSSIPTNKKADVITRALAQVDGVSELTREITFLVGQKELVLAFLKGIRMLGSTNIQHVAIIRAWKADSVDSIPPQAIQLLPPQPNLTSLKFQIHSDFQYDRTTGCKEFQPLLQIWLNSAPNLTSLDVATSFYPNLEACTSLIVLKFKFLKCCDEHYRHLNVTKMLTQVKDSLIELELCHYVTDYVSLQQIQPAEEVPVMSRLTSLTIHAEKVYEIHDFYNEKRFPKLRSISLRTGFQPSSLLKHLNLWIPHRGVKSVTLILDYYSWEVQEFGGKMINLFPSVKEFDLRMGLTCFAFPLHLPEMFLEGEPVWRSTAIQRFMEPFQMWDLKRVNVSLRLPESALLINALQAISVLKGVKRVQFFFRCIYNTRVNFSASLVQDVILHSGAFKSVEITIHEMAPEIVEQLQLIVEASGAPIRFIGRSE